MDPGIQDVEGVLLDDEMDEEDQLVDMGEGMDSDDDAQEFLNR